MNLFAAQAAATRNTVERYRDISISELSKRIAALEEENVALKLRLEEAGWTADFERWLHSEEAG